MSNSHAAYFDIPVWNIFQGDDAENPVLSFFSDTAPEEKMHLTVRRQLPGSAAAFRLFPAAGFKKT
jgi:hypothetical protein